MKVAKYGRRFWAVYDECGLLVVVCVYRKGACEVVRRLTGQEVERPRRTRRKVETATYTV